MASQLGASSSSLSSLSIYPQNHDVFLSFRGKDVRHKFISHLNRALCQSGIKTYMDGVNLERGEQISSEVFKAIEESRISIIVLSKNYAESKYCLHELLKILECKKIFKQIVLPIFYEIKPSDVRDQKGSFGEAFIKLGKKIKDDRKLLEYWKEALEEVAKLSGLEYTAFGLKDKCLITTEYGYVWMHDLLQDMGREIVRLESPNEPGQRSRLFFNEDVRHVLEENMGTNKVVGMIIEMPEGEDVIRLNSKAFVQMKRLRVLINRNASFSSGPNYLSNELRVLDWFTYPLQSLPLNFHGNKLIIFKMRRSFIRELSFIKYKNMTIMEFSECNFLTKFPDVSSIPNLKELIAPRCRSLVEVHDSVGSLENLCQLDFSGCSNLRIFPASLKLRSLCTLYLNHCSSLRSFPEIGCEMKCLTTLALSGTVVEELPLSIGNLIRIDELLLNWIFDDCTNLVKKMGYDGQSIPAIWSTTMEDEISSNEEQVQELAPPTNSSNGSSALQVLNRQNCFQSESNFFSKSSFFTTLTFLNLSRSEFVSLPTSIKGFVALKQLYLCYCEKLEEILELPQNIGFVDVMGCKSLERFPEVLRIVKFNASHIRLLRCIRLHGCDKMAEKIWNYKVPSPLLWKGHYDAIVDRGDEEWVINIEGPHHLEDISGIVVYSLMVYKGPNIHNDYKNFVVTIESSNRVCHLNINQGVYLFNSEVIMWYSNLESLELKVLDNLRVQLQIPGDGALLRMPYYRSWGANIVYKHESIAHKRRKMD